MEIINSISGSKRARVGTAVVKRMGGKRVKMHCEPKVYTGHRCPEITVRRYKRTEAAL